MRALIQRVRCAKVTVDRVVQGEIGLGLLVLLGVTHSDTEAQADHLAGKVVQLRIFPDREGKMNRSLLDISGEMLVVPQFTLYADTQHGNRPSYSGAAPPSQAEPLYGRFVDSCRRTGIRVDTGKFQAHMMVDLTNDGPVTLLCEVNSK